jgi:hypothetical protein
MFLCVTLHAIKISTIVKLVDSVGMNAQGTSFVCLPDTQSPSVAVCKLDERILVPRGTLRTAAGKRGHRAFGQIDMRDP